MFSLVSFKSAFSFSLVPDLNLFSFSASGGCLGSVCKIITYCGEIFFFFLKKSSSLNYKGVNAANF